MKILHLDFDDLESPTAGGQAVRTFEINRRLAQKGHQITVVTLTYPGAKNKTKENIHYERCGIKHYPLNFISYFLAVPFILFKHDFDLVVEDNIPPTSFGLSPWYTSKPVISQIQSLFAHESSKKHGLPFWIVEKYTSKIYKNFIVLTENVKEQIQKLNKRARIQVISNGLSKVYPQHVEHKKQLLFLGRIDYYHKGLEHLIKIAKILQTTLPDYKIIIAGDGRDVKKLQEDIAKNNLKNVDYIGKIDGSTKEDYIKNAIALLLPSHFETLPFTMLEAASHGKPTIFFDIPNLHELAKKQIGIEVPAFDETKFADAIEKLCADKNLLKTLSDNAHAWAQEHLWDKIVEEQEKFYMSCLKK